MCGRFFMAVEDPELSAILKQIEADRQRFEREAPFLPPVKRGEIRPTDHVAVRVGGNMQKPLYQQMQWGFSGFDGKGVLINARSETLLQKPTFRKPALESRCLIPASYYFEWKNDPLIKKKTRYIMRDPSSTTMYMAGIFRLEAPDITPRFVILTKEAATRIRDIHGRMPVILSRSQQEEWLSDKANIDGIIKTSSDNIIGLEADQEP